MEVGTPSPSTLTSAVPSSSSTGSSSLSPSEKTLRNRRFRMEAKAAKAATKRTAQGELQLILGKAIKKAKKVAATEKAEKIRRADPVIQLQEARDREAKDDARVKRNLAMLASQKVATARARICAEQGLQKHIIPF